MQSQYGRFSVLVASLKSELKQNPSRTHGFFIIASIFALLPNFIYGVIVGYIFIRFTADGSVQFQSSSLVSLCCVSCVQCSCCVIVCCKEVF